MSKILRILQQLLLLASLLSPSSRAATISSTCISNSYCVYSSPDGKGNVQITLHSAATSWAALGTGSSMSGAFMMIVWNNSTGGYTVSDRTSRGQSQPSPTTEVSAVIPLVVAAPSWASLAVSFTRPISTNSFTFTSTTNFIYAYSSSSSISSPDSTSASFNIHDRYGNLGNLDFTSNHTGVGTNTGSGNGAGGLVSLPAGLDYNDVLKLHGYINIIAWLICPLIGIFIARYLKDKLGIWWFRLHVAFLGVGTGVGSFIAIILIFVFKDTSSSGQFSSSVSIHPLLGLLIFLGMCIQICLGIYSDGMWTPDRTSIPWWDVAHWYVGRTLVCFAAVNIITGIVYSNNFGSYTSGYIVLSVLALIGGVAMFIYGERRFGQIHHMNHQETSPIRSSQYDDGTNAGQNFELVPARDKRNESHSLLINQN